MLAAMSGQTPPPSLARVVFAETEGNPFFVEEVFRHLSEEGRLFDETGKWRQGLRVDQSGSRGCSPGPGRRLERLGGDAPRTHHGCGDRTKLQPAAARRAGGRRPDAALEAVEEADARISGARTWGRDTRYRFVHELIRQTLAEGLSLPRRQRLHARVADAMSGSIRLPGQAAPRGAPSLSGGSGRRSRKDAPLPSAGSGPRAEGIRV